MTEYTGRHRDRETAPAKNYAGRHRTPPRPAVMPPEDDSWAFG